MWQPSKSALITFLEFKEKLQIRKETSENYEAIEHSQYWETQSIKIIVHIL